MSTPKKSHMDVVVNVAKYLKQEPGLGLFMPANSFLMLKCYCDLDWEACLESRRLVLGYIVQLGSYLISRKSKKQGTVSRSSAEAKYRAMGNVVLELVWVLGLLKDLCIEGLESQSN